MEGINGASKGYAAAGTSTSKEAAPQKSANPNFKAEQDTLTQFFGNIGGSGGGVNS